MVCGVFGVSQCDGWCASALLCGFGRDGIMCCGIVSCRWCGVVVLAWWWCGVVV